MNLYSAKEMTDLLERHDFFFKKNLGQNFLMNEAVSLRIATASRETLPDDGKTLALEIGPGAGSLTIQLSKLFTKVLALEIDPHLMGVLEESLSEKENVTVINTDALKFNFNSIAKTYPDYHIAVCSNLPYYITSEIIMRLLESDLPIASITVLIQKEAAVRLSSKPGDPNYGSICASVSFYAKTQRLFNVGPGNFVPRPKVDSAVLRLIPHETPPVSVSDKDLFFRLIKAAFLNRRKVLSNTLYPVAQNQMSKEDLIRIMTDAGIDPLRRGETLSLEEFAILTDVLNISEE